MNIWQKKSWILPVFVFFVFIVNLPAIPTTINVVGSFILAFMALTSNGIIFLYYNSLPAPRKTILVYLTQFLMLLNTITLILGTFNKFSISVLPKLVEDGFRIAPNLTCSLLHQEPPKVLLFNCLFTILLFKAMAAAMSSEYLSMDHYRLWKITLGVMIFTWILEYLVIFSIYGTLCSKQYIDFLQTFHGLKFDSDFLRHKPPTSLIHMAIILLPRVALVLVKMCKRRVSERVGHFEMNTLNTDNDNRGQQMQRYFQTKASSSHQEIEQKFDVEINSLQIVDIEDNIESLQEERTNNVIEFTEDNHKEEEEVEDTLENVSNSSDSCENVQPLDPNCLDPKLDTDIGLLNANLSNYTLDPTNPTSIPPVLKTDIAIWLITVALVLAMYVVFVNDNNNNATGWIFLMVGRLFYLVLPHYWILRSDEKLQFYQRRFNRLINNH